MKSPGHLFKFYINSSIHTGLAVSCFALVTILEYRLPVNYNLLSFIFLGTITSYNFVKYAGIARLHHFSLANNLKIIQIFSFFCFLALLYFSLQLDYKTLFVSLILAIFTLLYVTPVFRGYHNLRNIKGIKVYIIAITAAGVGVMLPLLNQPQISPGDQVMELFQRVLIHLLFMLPFEIRDLRYDPSSLHTIPQLLGVRRTKIFGSALIIPVLILEISRAGFIFENFLGLILICTLGVIMLWASRTNQKKYYASFWVEAAPVFWVLSLVILNNLLS